MSKGKGKLPDYWAYSTLASDLLEGVAFRNSRTVGAGVLAHSLLNSLEELAPPENGLGSAFPPWERACMSLIIPLDTPAGSGRDCCQVTQTPAEPASYPRHFEGDG
jgi:hypothetical protein